MSFPNVSDLINLGADSQECLMNELRNGQIDVLNENLSIYMPNDWVVDAEENQEQCRVNIIDHIIIPAPAPAPTPASPPVSAPSPSLLEAMLKHPKELTFYQERMALKPQPPSSTGEAPLSPAIIKRSQRRRRRQCMPPPPTTPKQKPPVPLSPQITVVEAPNMLTPPSPQASARTAAAVAAAVEPPLSPVFGRAPLSPVLGTAGFRRRNLRRRRLMLSTRLNTGDNGASAPAAPLAGDLISAEKLEMFTNSQQAVLLGAVGEVKRRVAEKQAATRAELELWDRRAAMLGL